MVRPVATNRKEIRNMPTLTEKADAALFMMERYQVAHVTMATAATMVVDLIIAGSFTVAEALCALADHVARYRCELATLDGQAVQP
jgi:hypothetical protein